MAPNRGFHGPRVQPNGQRTFEPRFPGVAGHRSHRPRRPLAWCRRPSDSNLVVALHRLKLGRCRFVLTNTCPVVLVDISKVWIFLVCQVVEGGPLRFLLVQLQPFSTDVLVAKHKQQANGQHDDEAVARRHESISVYLESTQESPLT